MVMCSSPSSWEFPLEPHHPPSFIMGSRVSSNPASVHALHISQLPSQRTATSNVFAT